MISKILWIGAATTITFFALPFGCSVVGIRNYEEPDFSVVEEEGDFQVREYADVLVAETTLRGDREVVEDSSFMRLFNYISGENQKDESISMTVPVFQENTARGETMAFVLPGKYSQETAPTPARKDITVKPFRIGKVATVHYSGYRSSEKFEAQTARLREWIAERGLKEISPPRSAAYDPPFTLPFFRRNEVLIQVE